MGLLEADLLEADDVSKGSPPHIFEQAVVAAEIADAAEVRRQAAGREHAEGRCRTREHLAGLDQWCLSKGREAICRASSIAVTRARVAASVRLGPAFTWQWLQLWPRFTSRVPVLPRCRGGNGVAGVRLAATAVQHADGFVIRGLQKDASLMDEVPTKVVQSRSEAELSG
jgi:hypothetical protein